ncbi:MAG: hypothetical protein ACK4LQ_02060 [Pararhodobacter sp.]
MPQITDSKYPQASARSNDDVFIMDRNGQTYRMPGPVLVPVTQTPTDGTPARLLKTGDSATLLSASPALRAAYGGTANAITLTTGAGISGTPPTGFSVRFRASAANTGAATIALDGGSAIACRTVTGVALPASYIRTQADTIAVFDGTFWVLSRQNNTSTAASTLIENRENGVQEAWRTINLGPGNAEGAGTAATPYRTAPFTWDLPTFVDPPEIGFTLKSASGLDFQQRAFVVIAFNVTTTSVASIRAINVLHGNTGADIIISARAIGRWY